MAFINKPQAGDYQHLGSIGATVPAVGTVDTALPNITGFDSVIIVGQYTKTAGSDGATNIKVGFNNDTGNNYDFLKVNNAALQKSSNVAGWSIQTVSGTTGQEVFFMFHFPVDLKPAAAQYGFIDFKMSLGEISGGTHSVVNAWFQNTAAITSLTFTTTNSNACTFTAEVYGIKT